jgi:hypothetical protein
MSDEDDVVAVSEAEPAGVENSEIVDNSEPTPEEEKPEEKPKVDRVQRRFDRLTREKNEAIAKAEYLEKVLSEGKEKPAKQETQASIKREDFASDGEWIEAIADAKAEQKMKAVLERQAQERQESEAKAKHETVAQKADKIFEAAAKLGDLDVEDFNEVTYTPAMSEAILESDVAAQLVFHLASNIELAEKIAEMSPTRQAVEIGKLEVLLSSDKPQVKKSAAPSPIKPVSGGGSAYKGLSDQASMEDWLRERNKQLRENR